MILLSSPLFFFSMSSPLLGLFCLLDNIYAGHLIRMLNCSYICTFKCFLQGDLLYNEYIVYNVDQIRMRYVIQVNFNFKWWLVFWISRIASTRTLPFLLPSYQSSSNNAFDNVYWERGEFSLLIGGGRCEQEETCYLEHLHVMFVHLWVVDVPFEKWFSSFKIIECNCDSVVLISILDLL